MLEHLIEVGVLLLIAPIICIFVMREYVEYSEVCTNVMVVQGIIAIALILIGIGSSLNG